MIENQKDSSEQVTSTREDILETGDEECSLKTEKVSVNIGEIIQKEVSPKFMRLLKDDESDDEEKREQRKYDLEKRCLSPISQHGSHELIMEIHNNLSNDPKYHVREKLKLMKILKDADFWFHKGIVQDKEGHRSTAIDCYKQALMLN